MKPICVECKLFFSPEKNGLYFEEGMPTSNSNGEKQWEPYKLWSGDLWKCRGCGAQIVVGVGQTRIAEHYEPDYTAKVQRFSPAFRVDDC